MSRNDQGPGGAPVPEAEAGGHPGRARLTLKPLQGPPLEALAIESQAPVVIGRAADCDICLVDPRLSRRHLKVEHRGRHWFVTDLGSRYGAYLHTVRLEPDEETQIEHLDLLHLGPWTFHLLVDGGASAGADPDEHATNPGLLDRLRQDRPSVRGPSWEEFDERYRPLVAGFARNRGLRGPDVDEVAAEVFARLVRSIREFDYDPEKGHFRGWLKKVTISVIARLLSRHGAGAGRPGGVEGLPPAEAAEVDRTWDLEWTRLILRRALEAVREQVEPRTWEAFDLYGRQDVPGRVVAERLGTTFANVRAAKANVMRRLRLEIRRLQPQEP